MEMAEGASDSLMAAAGGGPGKLGLPPPTEPEVSNGGEHARMSPYGLAAEQRPLRARVRWLAAWIASQQEARRGARTQTASYGGRAKRRPRDGGADQS